MILVRDQNKHIIKLLKLNSEYKIAMQDRYLGNRNINRSYLTEAKHLPRSK